MGHPKKPSDSWRLNRFAVISEMRYRLRNLKRDIQHLEPKDKGVKVVEFLEKMEDLLEGRHT